MWTAGLVTCRPSFQIYHFPFVWVLDKKDGKISTWFVSIQRLLSELKLWVSVDSVETQLKWLNNAWKSAFGPVYWGYGMYN